MRKFAISGALCAIVMSAGLASAKDDFSALLSELSYNQPAPTQASFPDYKIAGNTGPQASATPVNTPVAAPQTAISMPPQQQAPVMQQYSQVAPGPASFQPGCDVGCASGGGCADGSCASGACGTGNCGLGGRGSDGCKDGFCTPHNMPNLPGSTLRQYWRSNACNSNVWDGYQNQCRKPLFGPKDRGCGVGGCSTAGYQGECASGACDITPPSQAACVVPSYIASPAAAACDSGNCDSGGFSF